MIVTKKRKRRINLNKNNPPEPYLQKTEKWGKCQIQSFKIIVEKYTDGYVAYPLGLKGALFGEGDTYEDAVADATSAIEFHIETFGTEAFENKEPDF